jgi:hypothetical protein
MEKTGLKHGSEVTTGVLFCNWFCSCFPAAMQFLFGIEEEIMIVLPVGLSGLTIAV